MALIKGKVSTPRFCMEAVASTALLWTWAETCAYVMLNSHLMFKVYFFTQFLKRLRLTLKLKRNESFYGVNFPHKANTDTLICQEIVLKRQLLTPKL